MVIFINRHFLLTHPDLTLSKYVLNFCFCWRSTTADGPKINLGENSAEQVAYKLMRDIAKAEGVKLDGVEANSNRQWIIKTYIMCRQAVAGHANVEHVLGLGN
ncbi:hypothetical protein [Sphingorhabdus sp.]|uniref:hypothetical protein n=1 Tax=Sphingorhabdus sp. TaxID=1902408 RepID=UPI0037C7595C